MFVQWDSISLLLTSKTNAFRNAPAGCPAFMIPTPRTHLIQTGRKKPLRGKSQVAYWREAPQASIFDAMPEIRSSSRLRKNKFPDCIS